MSNLKDIVIDCADPWTLAHWWAPILGYTVQPHSADDIAELAARGITRIEDDDSIALDAPDGNGPGFFFELVPESKTVKNRIHIDVFGDVEAIIGAGATLVEQLPHWIVLADPEGNEFCVFTRRVDATNS